MPKLTGGDLETMNIKGTSFQYSGARVQTLGATKYTLVTIITDLSGSVSAFKDDLEKCLKEIVTACRRSPNADNLLLRLITFHSSISEVHGYKLLTDCNPDDYLGTLQVGGVTALFDATANGIVATADYAKTLLDKHFDINAIIFVLTDGDDNASTYTVSQVKKEFEKAVKLEYLESLVSVLIGVNVSDPGMQKYLKDYKDNAGFTQYEQIDKANEKTLAKLAAFVSKSISSSSNSLCNGAPSTQASLTI